MTIGEMIREKRKNSGLTMAELGKRIGVTAAAISRYELGQRELTLDTIQAIADALGIHIFDLMGVGENLKNVHMDLQYSYIDPVSGLPGKPPPGKKEEIEKLLSADVGEVYNSISNEQKTKFWEILMGGGAIPKFDLNSTRSRINAALDQMNDTGQRRVADYAEDILPRYRTTRRQEAAEAPLPSLEGTDTTPPPEGSEGSPNGEQGGGIAVPHLLDG